jgi:predicted MFS family arabinose efflux permease
MALLSMLMFMMAQFVTIIFVAPLAEYAGGVNKDALPFALFVYGIGAVAGMQFGGRIADRFGAHRTAVLAVAVQIALLCALVVAGTLPSSIGAIVFFVFMPAIALVGWGYYPAQASLVSSLVPGSPILALSLNLTAMNIGIAIAAWLGGDILDQAGVFWLAVSPIPIAVATLLVTQMIVPRKMAVI